MVCRGLTMTRLHCRKKKKGCSEQLNITPGTHKKTKRTVKVDAAQARTLCLWYGWGSKKCSYNPLSAENTQVIDQAPVCIRGVCLKCAVSEMRHLWCHFTCWTRQTSSRTTGNAAPLTGSSGGGTDVYTEYLLLVDAWRDMMTSSWALGKHWQHFPPPPPIFCHVIDWTRNRLKQLQVLLSS